MNERRDGYASPPCAAHEVGDDAGRPLDDVKAWRRAERERLIKVRREIGRDERRALDARIAGGLNALLGEPSGRIISVYWPVRGEPDLREWYDDVAARGARLALPVVVEPGRPLVFRAWTPGDTLIPGTFNIPVPRPGPELVPGIVLSPVVGYDAACHRLGNGGGYYDRTLAALAERPLVVGVGYTRCELRTIYPQAFDIAMDHIVTEAGIVPSPGH
ncbi:MAG: 5-formyltetrahydrofolate cyclo-ligase [Woeseiaceae bacterium]|nr:5-formyltetrahydrofolate cyclo-ligase [Woeseiaceae bacterium]